MSKREKIKVGVGLGLLFLGLGFHFVEPGIGKILMLTGVSVVVFSVIDLLDD
jgi:hypothetical protein